MLGAAVPSVDCPEAFAWFVAWLGEFVGADVPSADDDEFVAEVDEEFVD